MLITLICLIIAIICFSVLIYSNIQEQYEDENGDSIYNYPRYVTIDRQRKTAGHNSRIQENLSEDDYMLDRQRRDDDQRRQQQQQQQQHQSKLQQQNNSQQQQNNVESQKILNPP